MRRPIAGNDSIQEQPGKSLWRMQGPWGIGGGTVAAGLPGF
jgi:hypothetical protein